MNQQRRCASLAISYTVWCNWKAHSWQRIRSATL